MFLLYFSSLSEQSEDKGKRLGEDKESLLEYSYDLVIGIIAYELNYVKYHITPDF